MTRASPPSPPGVDRVRVAFAEAQARGLPDLHVPAEHSNQWSGLLSDLHARTHDLAAQALGMACEGTYPLADALDWTAQLFSSRLLVTAVPREMDRLYTQLAAPSVTFIRAPLGDDQAVEAWARLLTEGAVPTEGLRFAAWVRMGPSTHTSTQAEFQWVYCSHTSHNLSTTMLNLNPIALISAQPCAITTNHDHNRGHFHNHYTSSCCLTLPRGGPSWAYSPYLPLQAKGEQTTTKRNEYALMCMSNLC